MDARFVRACRSVTDFPDGDLPEVAVAGRSNCGKSSLINALAGRNKLARVSTTPGRTQQIIFYQIELPGAPPFHLVDLPGYGYARASKALRAQWDVLITDYIERRAGLGALLILADIRRVPAQEERDLLEWVAHRALRPLVVLTKADKVGKSLRSTAVELAKRELGLPRRPLAFSVHDQAAVVALREAVLELVAGSRPAR